MQPSRQTVPLVLATILAAACAPARSEAPEAAGGDSLAHDPAVHAAHGPAQHAAHMAHLTHAQPDTTDSTFAALQARGASARGMGVDQYTSVHRFDSFAGGGRIELQRDASDSAGVAQIRAHLQAIAAAFRAGDFTTPAFVHMREVPGTDVMAARRGAITYTYQALPGGGEVRITTRDPEARRAVHAFLAFQREDHRVH